jgi:hypothetical protein
MSLYLEYDVPVRRSIPAPVVVFGLLTLPLFFAASSYAQLNGAPVTSAQSHMATGAASSPTSPVHFQTGAISSPTGPVRPPTGTVPNVNSLVPTRVAPVVNGNHRHHHRTDVGPVWYAVPVPYPVDGSAYSDADNSNADNPNEDDSDNYQGGPTVFDRRGDGADSYVPPVDDPRPSHAAEHVQSIATSTDAPQPTVLVFKDGHKLEVVNYAIIGSTLFDMTPGHARKVPLADLDLEATQEQNEEQGVSFQLPMSSQAN